MKYTNKAFLSLLLLAISVPNITYSAHDSSYQDHEEHKQEDSFLVAPSEWQNSAKKELNQSLIEKLKGSFSSGYSNSKNLILSGYDKSKDLISSGYHKSKDILGCSSRRSKKYLLDNPKKSLGLAVLGIAGIAASYATHKHFNKSNIKSEDVHSALKNISLENIEQLDEIKGNDSFIAVFKKAFESIIHIIENNNIDNTKDIKLILESIISYTDKPIVFKNQYEKEIIDESINNIIKITACLEQDQQDICQKFKKQFPEYILQKDIQESGLDLDELSADELDSLLEDN